jgi:hypothetical protein
LSDRSNIMQRIQVHKKLIFLNAQASQPQFVWEIHELLKNMYVVELGVACYIKQTNQ